MRGTFRSPVPIQCGMIACTTLDAYNRQMRDMAQSNGFLSRFLTVSFSHSPRLVEYIHQQIDEGVSMNHAKPPLVIPDGRHAVSLPRHISQKLRKRLPAQQTNGAIVERSMVDVARDQGDTYGYRTHSQLRNLLKANALRHGRLIVNNQDWNDMAWFSNFFGLRLAELDYMGEQQQIQIEVDMEAFNKGGQADKKVSPNSP